MAGKTSLIQRYITELFAEHGTQTTLSWDFKIKTIGLDNPDEDHTGSIDSRASTVKEQIRLMVWDTAG